MSLLFFCIKLAFSAKIFYTINCIGGIHMNKFEQDVQSKNHDVVDSIKGFSFSFIFFAAIFTIGAVISHLN